MGSLNSNDPSSASCYLQNAYRSDFLTGYLIWVRVRITSDWGSYDIFLQPRVVEKSDPEGIAPETS